jgi:hypothetical protein
MIILVVLAIAILVALVLGGKIAYLADLNLKWRGVIIAGFLIQIIVYNDFWQNNSSLKGLTTLAYFVSLGLLVIALARNHAIPGMKLIAFGFFLNVIAISLNGGYMPASLDAWTAAGFHPLLSGQTYNNSIGMGPNTFLPFLGDIFAIPHGVIFSNVFSLGDLFIALGAVYLIQKIMVKPKREQK